MWNQTLKQQTLIPFPPNPHVTLTDVSHEYEYKKNWYRFLSKKNKRQYHRLKSGERLAKMMNVFLIFITLTTAPNAKGYDLSKDFQVFRKRVYRKYGVLPAYCKVNTNEGNGVIHALLRTNVFIPQAWVSRQWDEIHGSYIVDVRQASNGTARYIATQYLATQDATYTRLSSSWTWVCRGMMRQWDYIVKSSRDWSHTRLNEYGLWSAPVQWDHAYNEWDRWLYDLTLKNDIVVYKRSIECFQTTCSPIDLEDVGNESIEPLHFEDHYFERQYLPDYYKNHYLEDDVSSFFSSMETSGYL